MTKSENRSADSKTCPACGGTWPSDRRNCLACGANLESVPALPAGQGQAHEPLEWAWLDAMANDRAASGAPEPAEDEEKQGCLARVLLG